MGIPLRKMCSFMGHNMKFGNQGTIKQEYFLNYLLIVLKFLGTIHVFFVLLSSNEPQQEQLFSEISLIATLLKHPPGFIIPKNKRKTFLFLLKNMSSWVKKLQKHLKTIFNSFMIKNKQNCKENKNSINSK